MTRKERASLLVERLPRIHPEAHCELIHRNPLELLVATILSAQCTDKRVNLVTPALFARCRSVADFAEISQIELEELIRTTGFFRSKARAIRGASSRIRELHDGEVPRTMDALAALPGVGRKTANVVLGNAFGINEGIVVDTHVGRLSRRLGLTTQTDPVQVERDLVRLFPRDHWTDLSHWLIFHGRRRCFARNPDCAACELADICPSAFKVKSARVVKSAGKV